MFAKKVKIKVRTVRRKQRKVQLKEFKRVDDSYFNNILISELIDLTPEEAIKYFPSRVRRSFKRGFFGPKLNFFKKLNEEREIKDIVLRTHFRDIHILPRAIGKTVAIHNGKKFLKIKIINEMLGHYLGEFALTRKNPQHASPGVGATKSSKAKTTAKK